MTYMELSSYIATANVFLSTAFGDMENDDLINNVRQALCETQLYFTRKALEELGGELVGDNDD